MFSCFYFSIFWESFNLWYFLLFSVSPLLCFCWLWPAFVSVKRVDGPYWSFCSYWIRCYWSDFEWCSFIFSIFGNLGALDEFQGIYHACMHLYSSLQTFKTVSSSKFPKLINRYHASISSITNSITALIIIKIYQMKHIRNLQRKLILALTLCLIVNCNIWDNIFSQMNAKSQIILDSSINLEVPLWYNCYFIM